MKLNGKICAVTGGASGIGLEIAKVFAAAGGKVAIIDIDIRGAKSVADALGSDHIAIEMDVTDPDAVERGIDKVVETYGSVDVLVSNAGVQMVKRLEAFEYDESEQGHAGRDRGQ
jgi:3-hydroxybutyrate dehydrogenase